MQKFELSRLGLAREQQKLAGRMQNFIYHLPHFTSSGPSRALTQNTCASLNSRFSLCKKTVKPSSKKNVRRLRLFRNSSGQEILLLRSKPMNAGIPQAYECGHSPDTTCFLRPRKNRKTATLGSVFEPYSWGLARKKQKLTCRLHQEPAADQNGTPPSARLALRSGEE